MINWYQRRFCLKNMSCSEQLEKVDISYIWAKIKMDRMWRKVNGNSATWQQGFRTGNASDLCLYWLDTQRQSNPARGGEGKLKLQTKICPNWSHQRLKFKLFSLIYHNQNNVIKAKDFVFSLKQQQHQMLIQIIYLDFCADQNNIYTGFMSKKCMTGAVLSNA